MPSASDREKALETALAQIDRQFGKGSVMRLGSDERAPIDVIPTGSIALDSALGVGGLPRGRIVEIYGPESSGKTTIALHAIASAQAAGAGRAICRQAEPPAAFVPARAHKVSVRKGGESAQLPSRSERPAFGGEIQQKPAISQVTC